MAIRYIRSSASTAELKLTVSIICAEFLEYFPPNSVHPNFVISRAW